MKGRRRRIDPAKAREAATGGWYARTETTTANWPTCGMCGKQVSVADHRSGECLRCKLNMARDGEQGDRAS